MAMSFSGSAIVTYGQDEILSQVVFELSNDVEEFGQIYWL
jgi:hypothetical protein